MLYRRPVPAIAAGAVLGAVLWVIFVGSAPRYSSGEEGSGHFWWTMLVGAVALGMGFRSDARAAAVALGVTPLLLAPWTAPRGDEDGLWILILPMLAIFAMVLVFVAEASVRALERLSNRERR